ncbi:MULTISPECIES: twin-arginine translocase TatA/TatE family subunit [unclassified Paenibacillus]|uniref:twin-arginine translocase TatA/TatE family subunit n=1 Tax=unclassified Paenibacillus TaxID=185978 RepID=UPI00104E0BB3|nr:MULTISPECIES: twin-arginine translocase TatA/TatE family subunit [unclassified Paenibacillus]NIK68992.1 sec-independent protein translocase protein TatA [Paenibacillus sp. BK720]TCM98736.1 sec-independent protein translocase protein TatA [Paenibacillus sp. BK033]
MPYGIGVTGFILIVVVGLLLFGPSKLPQLGRAIGSTFSEFRKGTREGMLLDEDKEDEMKK